MIIDTTHVWRINGQLIVADTIEKAIELFKNEYEYPANEVDKIERVYNDGHSKTSVAYMETKVAYMETKVADLKDNGKPVDCMVDVDSMVDNFSDVKCDNTITLVGDGVKGEIRDSRPEDFKKFEDFNVILTKTELQEEQPENNVDLEPF